MATTNAQMQAIQEGAVPMDRQMDMFEEGGLKDEGGTIDPVSGNDVPPGSTQEEVRDDIPAQLSEGEFVFPADVVRYIGLEKLMQMRQEAKMGLAMMDRMGQMGNSEEAVVPDDIPFDLSDLDMDDDLEYNVGGFVPATQQQQQFGISGFTPAAAPTTGVAPAPVQAASAEFARPQQASVPVATQRPMPFTTFLGPGVPQVDYEFGTFRNEAGQTIQLKIKKGSKGELLPGEVLPEGYVYVDPTATATEAVTTTPTTGQTATVRDDDSDERRRREEEAKYGPGGGRIGLGGVSDGKGSKDGATIVGVSFDGAGLGVIPGLITGKGIPEDATATFFLDGRKVTVDANKYNRMKENNFMGEESNQILKDVTGQSAKEAREARLAMTGAEDQIREAREARENFESSFKDNSLVVDRKDGAIKVKPGASAAEKAKAQQAILDYAASMATDDDEDDGPSGTSYSMSDIGSDQGNVSAPSDFDSSSSTGFEGYDDDFYNKGGFVEKRHSKTPEQQAAIAIAKKARGKKRGGLASKK